MTGDYAHDEAPPNPKAWRTLTEAQRLSLVEGIQITYPRLHPLIDALDNCDLQADEPDSRMPSGLAIVGPAGVGKTALMDRWIRRATAQHIMSEEEHTLPYVYVCLPAQVTSKGMLALCLTVLGDPAPLKGSLEGQIKRLLQLIHILKVRILVIDELECLVDRETQRIRYPCVDTLESILTQAGVSTVLVGCSGDTELILRASPRLEYLVGSPRFLQPFEWDQRKPTSIDEFRMLMRTIDHALPFDNSGFAEREMAYCWYYATNGLLGWVIKLLRYAARKAVQYHEATVSRSLLADAYQICIAETSMGDRKVNPFAVLHFSEPEGK
jgi:hypothetical protein